MTPKPATEPEPTPDLTFVSKVGPTIFDRQESKKSKTKKSQLKLRG